MSETFISYSRKDEVLVQRLGGDLRAAGADPWIDKERIGPGQRWDEVLEAALGRCECLLAVISPYSVESGTCQAEWLEALDSGKMVIPILIAEAKIPFYLKVLQHIDFLADYEAGLQRLVEALGVKPVGVKLDVTTDVTTHPPPPIAIDWVEIPAGPFTRGCPEAFITRIQNDHPKVDFSVLRKFPWREEELDRFWIARTAVTKDHYRRFVQSTGHRSPEGWPSGPEPFTEEEAGLPVAGVSWQDAADFAAWARARLPNRAECEKACRGTDGRLYPWGNEFESERCNTVESKRGVPTRGDEFRSGASPFGVLDLVGNVWEWVEDGEKGFKMMAGASFGSSGEIYGASFFNVSRSPEDRAPDLGFRLARSEPPPAGQG